MILFMLHLRPPRFLFVLLLLFAGFKNTHANTPLNLNLFDKQIHGIVAFQATLLSSKMLEELGSSKSLAMFFSGTAVTAVAAFKEAVIDSTFDPIDFEAGILGMILGLTGEYFWPESRTSDPPLWFEPEGGLIYFAPAKQHEGIPSPPPSLMLQAQTTFWTASRLGLHLFSGGAQASREGKKSKQLLFGGGLRLSLLQGKQNAKETSRLSLWVGADYGFLFFASDDLGADYPTSGYAPFYSLGARWKLDKERFFVGLQSSWVPYSSMLLMGTSIQVGFQL